MKTVSDIIDTIGARELASAASVPVGAVRLWKYRNCIPRGRWPFLMERFPELTLERLTDAEREAA